MHSNSKTQQAIATSSAEAELYAISSTIADAIHLKQLITEIENNIGVSTFDFDKHQANIVLFCDSSSATSLVQRMGISKRTKHIQLRFLWIQDLHQAGQHVLCCVPQVVQLRSATTTGQQQHCSRQQISILQLSGGTSPTTLDNWQQIDQHQSAGSSLQQQQQEKRTTCDGQLFGHNELFMIQHQADSSEQPRDVPQPQQQQEANLNVRLCKSSPQPTTTKKR